MKPDYKLVAKAKYIHMTADLASEIWHEVYKRYFPAKQLDALVDNLQSADAIEEDIDNDVNYFLVFSTCSTSTSSPNIAARPSAGTLWPLVSVWLAARAAAASGAVSTPRRCLSSSSSRPEATAPSALPKMKAASTAAN